MQSILSLPLFLKGFLEVDLVCFLFPCPLKNLFSLGMFTTQRPPRLNPIGLPSISHSLIHLVRVGGEQAACANISCVMYDSSVSGMKSLYLFNLNLHIVYVLVLFRPVLYSRVQRRVAHGIACLSILPP